MRRRRGFTVIELMAGLATALFIVTAASEFFALNRNLFDRLKVRQANEQAALGALDRLRIDLLHAGEGLAHPAGLGLLEPVVEASGSLRIVQAEKALRLAANAAAGSERVTLASTLGAASGREVVLCEKGYGEVLAVKLVDGKSLVMASPLAHSYAESSAEVWLLNVIVYTLDGTTLRRKVNRASAQPLLENAGRVTFGYDAGSSLASCALTLSPPGGISHAVTVLVKNAALSRLQSR